MFRQKLVPCAEQSSPLIKCSEFQIVLLLERIVGEMSPKIAKLLQDTIDGGGGDPHDDPNLLQYLDEHLVFLRDHLSAPNFDRAIGVLWNCCMDVISEAAQVSYSLVYGVTHQVVRLVLRV